MNIDLEALGVTKEVLVEMVVSRIVDNYEGHDFDSGISHQVEQALLKKGDERIAAKVDEALPAVFDQLIADARIFKPSNRYGDRSTESMSFTDYLVQMAEKYLTTDVDYDGRDRSYSGGKCQPRIVWMVHKHLEDQVRNSVTGILQRANEILGTSVQAVVTDALKRVEASIKVQVK